MDLKKLKKHTLGWLLLVLYENLILANTFAFEMSWYHYLLHLTLVFLIFYFNSFLVFNSQLSLKTSAIFIILLSLSEVLIYIALATLLELLQPESTWKNFDTYLQKNHWRFFYIVHLSIFYWCGVAYYKQKQKADELAKMQAQLVADKAATEQKLQVSQTAFLQSQINPHLLFNTLNFIYSSVQKASREASEMVLIVNDLMRFALQQPDTEGKIELAEEVRNIINFTRLNRLRYTNKIFLNTIITGTFVNVKIHPQILLPLVENIFKHGDLKYSYSPGLVHISHLDDILYFRLLNKKRKGIIITGNSIGITNVKNRLNNYYPNKHEFKIHETKESFQINLVIKLK